ncbi:hypothetical protein OG21DRAFT_1491097 [Imleria badia]|nr:hypothetical protein OG21DRAFT_1491097 [Imleria badia]
MNAGFCLLLCGTPDTPKFNGTASRLISYFDDIDILNDEQKVKAAIRYADFDEAELWEILREVSAANPDWAVFTTTVKKYYPGCQATSQYCRVDLTNLIQDY